MKKIIALAVALVLTLSLTAAFADTITIAVPNDPTNEGRALNILQDAGVSVAELGGVGLVLNVTRNRSISIPVNAPQTLHNPYRIRLRARPR